MGDRIEVRDQRGRVWAGVGSGGSLVAGEDAEKGSGLALMSPVWWSGGGIWLPCHSPRPFIPGLSSWPCSFLHPSEVFFFLFFLIAYFPLQDPRPISSHLLSGQRSSHNCSREPAYLAGEGVIIWEELREGGLWGRVDRVGWGRDSGEGAGRGREREGQR